MDNTLPELGIKPYYSSNWIAIYHADCRDILPRMADGSIDFVFTDAPYGHNNNNNGDLIHRWEAALGRLPCGVNTPLEARPIANDGAEANELVRWAFGEFNRLLQPGCCCCCCGGGGGPDPQFARWSLWLDETVGFKQMVVWDKGCFHPQTRVPCRINGEVCFAPIAGVVQAAESGKSIEVVSPDGTWSDVCGSNSKSYDGDLVVIRSQDGSILRVTPNHPIKTVDGVKRADQLTCEDRVPVLMAKRHDIGADSVQVVDLFGRDLLVGRLKQRSAVRAVDLANYLGLRYNKAQWWLHKNQVPLAFPVALDEISAVRVHFGHAWFPLEIPLDYEFGWFVGFYVAEGSLGVNSLQLTHHSNETEYADAIRSWCDKFAISCKTEVIVGCKSCTRINSKLLNSLISKLVTGTATTKQLTTIVLNAAPAFLSGVLDGWIAGDGCIKKRRFEGVSASRLLIEQMSWLLRFRGQPSIVSTIHPNYVKVNGAKSVAYKLRCTPLGHYNNVFARNDGLMAWVKVVSLSREKYVGKVYDITVNHPTHLFYADNGVLAHNSMGMGWHYRRSYETVLVGEKPGAACRWFDESDRIENVIRHIPKIIPSARQHPTVKPVQLASHFIRLHTRPGDLVLDPFAGSGTTLIAARDCGCRAVGVELGETYCEMAVRRLSQNVFDFEATEPVHAVGTGEAIT